MTRNILLATLFTLASAIVLVAIFLTEKTERIPRANAATLAVQLERGALDYEQYCATCHGLAGQGAANETGAPQLNNIVQRYTTPAADGTAPFDAKYGVKEKYGTMQNYVEAVIISGIRGTPMPAWSQNAGGPLRPDQIENITAYVLSWNGQVPESAVAVAETVAAELRPTADPNATPLGAGQAMFQTKACVGCHAVTDEKLVGPGLGGLFQPEGTAAFGTKLPNGKDVTDENVYEWIVKGTDGFPEHIDPIDGEQYGKMPAIALTEDEYAKLVVYLKAIKRDGTLVEGADAAPDAEPGTLQPTVQPTTQPGNSPDASATTPATAP
jgi:cytochrome c oxidase cbb3-type subunit 3